MRTLFLECNSGASGDMLLGALADLMKDPFELKGMIEGTGIPGISVDVDVDENSSVSGLRVHIAVDGVEEGDIASEKKHHDKRNLKDIVSLIESLNVSDMVKSDAEQIYAEIADAESNVHGKPVNEIHFHEVGALDAVADIIGCCMMVELLAPEQIIASPIRTGYGTIECAHGVLPVPAPATAYILKGIPVFAGNEEGEFCTPTGAAIVKHFAEKFGEFPLMSFEDTGYGLGSRNYKTGNCLRAFIGKAPNVLPTIRELVCNVDDMTPEDMGGIIDLLIGSGALDAFIVNCIMKKSRPGFELVCLCREEDADDLATIILAHTSTIGIRVHTCERYTLSSRFETYRTEFGDVRIKISEGYGIRKWKPEHEDLVNAAATNDVTVSDVRDCIRYDPDEEDGDD